MILVTMIAKIMARISNGKYIGVLNSGDVFINKNTLKEDK